MKKAAFNIRSLFILLTMLIGVQATISCATGVGDENSNGQGTNSGQSNGSGGGNSAGSGGGNSSGSVSGGGNSSGSTGGGYLPTDCSDYPEPDPQKPPKEGPVFQDTRNGIVNSYKTVIIGTQTWMAENLNYEPLSAPGMHKCYMEGHTDKFLTKAQAQANCDKYGRLYDWATAQTVCPDGWHLPSREEWNALDYFVWDELYQNYEDCAYGWDVGTKLKSTSNWKSGIGVDSYGFNAIGSGYCYLCDDGNLNIHVGKYSSEYEETHWWSSTTYVNQWNPSDATQAYKFNMTAAKNVMNENYDSKSDFLYSVRCIKD